MKCLHELCVQHYIYPDGTFCLIFAENPVTFSSYSRFFRIATPQLCRQQAIL